MLRTAEDNVASGYATTVEEATAVLSMAEDAAFTETPPCSRLEYVWAFCAILAKYPQGHGSTEHEGGETRGRPPRGHGADDNRTPAERHAVHLQELEYSSLTPPYEGLRERGVARRT